jgi:hypothetical protein
VPTRAHRPLCRGPSQELNTPPRASPAPPAPALRPSLPANARPNAAPVAGTNTWAVGTLPSRWALRASSGRSRSYRPPLAVPIARGSASSRARGAIPSVGTSADRPGGGFRSQSPRQVGPGSSPGRPPAAPLRDRQRQKPNIWYRYRPSSRNVVEKPSMALTAVCEGTWAAPEDCSGSFWPPRAGLRRACGRARRLPCEPPSKDRPGLPSRRHAALRAGIKSLLKQ